VKTLRSGEDPADLVDLELAGDRDRVFELHFRRPQVLGGQIVGRQLVGSPHHGDPIVGGEKTVPGGALGGLGGDGGGVLLAPLVSPPSGPAERLWNAADAPPDSMCRLQQALDGAVERHPGRGQD